MCSAPKEGCEPTASGSRSTSFQRNSTPALAVLPSLGTATPPQRRPPRAAVAGQSLPQVSHRLHCQRDEPLPKRAAGGSLLLPLHRSPAAVGAAHLRVRWEAGDPGVSRLSRWSGEDADPPSRRVPAAGSAARLASLPAGCPLLWAVPAAAAKAAGKGGSQGEPFRRPGPCDAPALACRAAAEGALAAGEELSGVRRPSARGAGAVSEEKPCEEKPANDPTPAFDRPARSINVSSAERKSGSRMTCSPSSMSLTRESRVRQRRSA